MKNAKKLISLAIAIILLLTAAGVTGTVNTSAAAVTFYKIIDWSQLDMGDDVYADGGYLSDTSYGDPNIFGPDRFENNFGGDGSSYFVMQNTSYVGAYGWSGPQVGTLSDVFQYAKPAHTKNMSDFDGVAFKIYFDDNCDPLDPVYGNPLRRVNVKISDKDGYYMWVSDTARVWVTKDVVDLSFPFSCFSKVVAQTGHPEDPDNLEYLADPSSLSNMVVIQISGWASEAFKGGDCYINDVYGYNGDFNPFKLGDVNGDGKVNEDDGYHFFDIYANWFEKQWGVEPQDRPGQYPWGEAIGIDLNALQALQWDGKDEMDEDHYNTLMDLWFPEPGGREKGDINNDGKVNGMDLLLMKQHILDVPGKKIAEGTEDFWAADMNDDGKINGMDLLNIKKVILGVK